MKAHLYVDFFFFAIINTTVLHKTEDRELVETEDPEETWMQRADFKLYLDF